MKRILASLFILTILTTAIFATSSVYPISVEEFMVGKSYRMEKTYQLSRTDDPSLIPTADFQQNGLTYTLLDITRTDIIGVDTFVHTETMTQPSKTQDQDQVLSQLAPTLDVTTQEGYGGTLLLDESSVATTVDGYATGSQDHSATRTYPNLSDSDTSLIPKTVEEDGRTLNLSDIQWAETLQNDGLGGTVTRYTATAVYTGTSNYQYPTGYTITADYTGEVAKIDTDIVEYTAMFGATETSEEPIVVVSEGVPEIEEVVLAEEPSLVPYAIGGGALVLLGGAVLLLTRKKRG